MSLDFDDLRTQAGRLLYRELPEEYRYRDEMRAGESGDLEAYLHGFGHLLDLVRATIEQAHADSFAEPVDFTRDPDTPAAARRILAIQPWLIPYLAELVGAELLAPDPAQRMKELNGAVTWFKSKGTLRAVDEVSDVVAGTESVVREGWRRTLICPRIGLPPFTVPRSTVADPLGAALPPPGTPDLRRPDRAVQDPSGASPLFRLRYPTRDAAAGMPGPEAVLYWKPRSRGGAPCFPGAYDDGTARCPDLRDRATIRDPGPHPRRTLVHVRTPDGLFAEGLLRVPLAGGTALFDAGRNEDGWRHVGPAEVLRAAGQDALAATAPDRLVVELADTAAVPNRGRLWLQGVLVVGAVAIETGGRLHAGRGAIESVTIEQPHDRRPTPSLSAEDCLFDRITSLSGWAELVYCTVLGDVALERLHASDSILAGTLSGVRCANRAGRPLTCIRFSRVPADAEAPDCASAGAPTNTGRRPHFVQRYFPADPVCALRIARYGEPGAGVLDTLSPRAIRSGAEDESEMGAHHHLHLGAALTALERKLADFLPLGQEIALRYDPLMAERPPAVAAP